MHTSDSLTGHVTESTTKVKATETPEVTLSKMKPGSTYPFTKVAGNASVDPTIRRKGNPIDDTVMTGTVVIVLVIVVAAIFLLLIALCLNLNVRYV